ncbi:MAG: AAA family ATPase [Pseudomonadota bacterium]
MPFHNSQKQRLAEIFTNIIAQNSTFTVPELRKTIHALSLDRECQERLFQVALRDSEILPLAWPECRTFSGYFTTRTVRDQEQAILESAVRLARINPVDRLLSRIAGTRVPKSPLDGEQRDAFEHATGPGHLKLINGRAGTGKSHTMAAIRAWFEAKGHNVIGLAPTNIVARDMRCAGCAAARTVHLECHRLRSSQASWNKSVTVILDEASMVGPDHLETLLTEATRARARLILVGDTRQLLAVGRQGLFGAISKVLGTAELTTNRRQRDRWQQQVAVDLSNGAMCQAVDKLEQHGAIHFSRDKQHACKTLVAHFEQATRERPSRSRFVFAYTNKDVSMLNEMLREALRRSGGLRGPDVMLRSANGDLAVALGDALILTSNDRALGLFNGMAGQLQAVTKRSVTIKLTTGDTITFDPRRYTDFTYGYAGTIHRGQGRTFDETYLLFSKHWTHRSTYVALTRHRARTHVYVDAGETPMTAMLASRMARSDDRPNAIELPVMSFAGVT